MKLFLTIVLSAFLSAPAFATQTLICLTPRPGDAPFHWEQLNVTFLQPGHIELEVVKGNPTEIGSISDLVFVKNVTPNGVTSQMYHGNWRNPAQSGSKTVTIYMTPGASGQAVLTYIAGMQPFHWLCRLQ